MNFESIENYLIVGAIAGFFIWRYFKFKSVRNTLPQLIAEGALVVDVRTPGEYQQGARPGSLNIPLADIAAKAKTLDKNKTIILCCASGSRSGAAAGILKSQGFTSVINAGSWTNTLT